MKRRHLAPLLLIPLLLASCESEPDAGDPGPPITGDLSPWAYPDGRHVTGTLSFEVTTEQFPGLRRVEAYIDDEFQGFRDGLAELLITVNARPYPAGPHTVMLVVQTRDAKSDYRYRGKLTFDHTPPSRGELVSVEVVDDRPLIRWRQNEDANFARYHLRREANGALPAASFDVFDRATTEMADVSLPSGAVGARLEYSVAIHNGYELSARDSRFVQIGDFLELAPYPGVEPTASPVDDRVYMVDNDAPARIVTFRAATNEVVDERLLASGSRALACARDGATLVHADASVLQILDAQTLDVARSIPSSNVVDATVGTDGRVFVARGGTAPSIDVFDAQLNLLDSIDVGASAPSWIAVAANSTRLYAINANPRTNPLGSLLSFDVSSLPATPMHTRDLSAGFVQAAASPGGDRVYLAHTRAVEVVDGETLAFAGRYPTPGDITGIALSGPSLYVAFGEALDEPPRIERADRSSLSRAWTWRLVGPARNLAVTFDDSRLYAYVTVPLAKMVGTHVR